jgi:hypothetical protein
MTPRLWPSRSPGFNPCNNYFGGYRKIRFLWKVHIICKNWKIIFKEKLLLFQDKHSIMCQTIFEEGEVNILKLCYGTV